MIEFISKLFSDQRLTASKVSTHQTINQILEFGNVINALRHQRLVHREDGFGWQQKYNSDQRLTASKVSTRYPVPFKESLATM